MKKLFCILLITTLISCTKTADDVRKIKVGMSGNELKYIMGEPSDMKIGNGKEVWRFRYSPKHFSVRDNWVSIEIVNDKIVDFTSY
jgi:hypothetical protein